MTARSLSSPNRPRSIAIVGAPCRTWGLSEEALAAFDRALAVQPDFPAASEVIGPSRCCCSAAPPESRQLRPGAPAWRPGLAAAHENRGVVLTALGRFEEASAAIETALRLAPGNARSYLNLVAARRIKPDDPHLATMRALVGASDSMSPAERADLSFALGKALDDIGDCEGSFLHLLEANAAQRTLTPYDEAATLAWMQAIATAFGGDVLRRHAGEGDLSAKPALIVGMPRSGTSLAEQILARHPEVFGAGESDDFEREAAKRAQGAGDGSLAAGLAAFVETGDPRARRRLRRPPRRPRAGGGTLYRQDDVEFPPSGPDPSRFAECPRHSHAKRSGRHVSLLLSHRFFGHLPWAYDLAEKSAATTTPTRL